MSEPATLIFRVSLRARLYRDIEVSSSSTLADLAEAIVVAFGFDMDHAYGFYSKLTGKLFDSPRRFELFADMEGSGSRSVTGTRVTTAFQKVGSAMTFLYDYGDEWRFRAEVIGTGQALPDANYPRIVSKIGKAPRQYPDIDDA
ncbi:plasmid pRiA4b ORF-3 family protein [Allomesorhizobium camelthorni]|uniref:Plasmid pRiA4b ORF-3 family protein n=1 Tax=Allomesorhizobium camelthorni TaxID=475069 RepID=A0A6G4WI13_9HYPH|nr:plasmid pRiA4b ORF-3 family protein [Mesorhizobium camelthorni]NGO54239.1 plasmid pRiA4b ORF-3 family protein [Mesorhizobium camelthorni]